MRKRYFHQLALCAFMLLCLASCIEKQTVRNVQLIISNSSNHDKQGVVNGISLQAVMDSLQVREASSIAILDEQGQPVTTQLFDNGQQKLLLFECSVLANGESAYTLSTKAANQQPLPPLPIAEQLRRLQQINIQADSARARLASAVYNWEINERTRQLDSILQLLDVSLLGGSLYPYPNSAPRNPWNYRKLDILSEGPLMCAYQLHYDTLRLAGDTLVEHRTLAMQRGSHITLVRDVMENAGHQDTLLLLNQLAIALPRQRTDSLIVRESLSYLILADADSGAKGLMVPGKSQSLTAADSRQVAFILPFTPDSVLTYFVANSAIPAEPLSLTDAQQELSQMQDAPLRARIVVHE